MREWNLKAPVLLTLAADARTSPTDYHNDQIWTLTLKGGEPQAVSLQTTYGLRARSFRLFPRFSDGVETRTDPATFVVQPAIKQFFPNYALVAFSPFPGIEVEAEYWIPGSQSAGGRLHIHSTLDTPRTIMVEWAALLAPAASGQRMAPTEIEGQKALAGITNDVFPVVLLTGSLQGISSPFPAFAVNVELPAMESYTLCWSHAALQTQEDSLHLARQVAARNWDAEIARLEMLNASQVEIHTGNPDWDAAFALSQRAALGLFLQPTQHLSHPSYVSSRQPDHGYSLRGDGKDYNHLWNGQTPLASIYLASLILPSAPQLVRGLLLNFTSVSGPDGFIDWKPGLAGQRSQLLASPLLAHLANQVFQVTQDRDLLDEIYPVLLRFIQQWFSVRHDRDQDGIPEWSHPMQAGFDDHPLFSHWYSGSQGADIADAESPALCALLYHECRLLRKFARELHRETDIPLLEAFAENLRSAVEINWDSGAAVYRYWDRDSHFTSSQAQLSERTGPGEIVSNESYNIPVRLLLRIQAAQEMRRPVDAFIHGITPGRQHLVEHITSDRFDWYLGSGIATSERVYASIERVVIEGISDDDCVTLLSVGFDFLDHTLLLPLWAHIPTPERAGELVNRTLTDPTKFWKDYGIPACGEYQSEHAEDICLTVHLPWNVLLGEGLLAYGYRAQAAELVSRIMSAIVKTLKTEGTFRKYYHADRGHGMGDHDDLEGLAPIGLFLETLGVQLISPTRVRLSGFNPFPWPVTVKYQGLSVFRQSEKTTVVFPHGETLTVTDPKPCIVALE